MHLSAGYVFLGTYSYVMLSVNINYSFAGCMHVPSPVYYATQVPVGGRHFLTEIMESVGKTDDSSNKGTIMYDKT